MLDEDLLHFEPVRQPDEVGQLVQVLAHDDHHHVQMRQLAAQPAARVQHPLDVAHDTFETGLEANPLERFARLRRRSRHAACPAHWSHIARLVGH